MVEAPRFPSGACHGLSPEIFFPERGGDTSTPKAICSDCIEKSACLDWAVHHERFGVWGGSTEQERAWIRKRLGIPRASLINAVPTRVGNGHSLDYLEGSLPAAYDDRMAL